MTVHRFLAAAIPPVGEELSLNALESQHATRVLRLQPGANIELLDGAGTVATAVISELIGQRRQLTVTCRVVERQRIAPPAWQLRLLIAPPRAKLMGQVVRQATELGVSRLTPVICEFAVAQPPNSASEHWRADSVVAAKQSGNAFLPQIDAAMPFAEALRQAGGGGFFGAVPEQAEAAADLTAVGGAVNLWIGPEAGFAAHELKLLRDHGVIPVSVGHWILRVETAVPALIGWLNGKGILL